MQVEFHEIDIIIKNALREDIGAGDVTSRLIIPEEAVSKMQFTARESLVMCGFPVMMRLFEIVNKEHPNAGLTYEKLVSEGQVVEAGKALLSLVGNTRIILMIERVTLNLMQHICAIATLANKYSDEIADFDIEILDTRKTLPGLREIEKYAVRIGGCHNHRMRLDDMIMIKDNHITAAGGITNAIKLAKSGCTGLKIEVECDNLTQVKEAIIAQPDVIMLDNMDIATMRKAVQMNAQAQGAIKLEASGGVTLKHLRDIAKTGVDYISTSALTMSAGSVDIGLDEIS